MLRIFILTVVTFSFHAQAICADVIDPKSLSKSFSKIPGTPRIAANEADQEWVVIWRQGTPGKIIGRIIESDGRPGPGKTLVKGIDSSSHSLDVAFDTVNARYLLAFESKRGLEIQLFQKSLSKQGASVLIEPGIQESHVRVVFDPIGNHFLLFWLADQDGGSANVLKVLILDSTANAINQPEILAGAGQNNHFSALSVARNEKNGRFMIMMLEETGTQESSVIGYMVKPDGNLLTAKASVFQTFTPALNTIPQACFANSGKGLAFWTDSNRLKTRKISDKGKPGASTNTVNTAPQPISPQPAITFDSQKNEFVALWAEQKQIKGARLNPATGKITEQFDVADSILDEALHIAVSFNAAVGNFLAVWEDAEPSNPATPPSKFRIRGGVPGTTLPGVVISGEPRMFEPPAVTVKVGTTVKWVNNTGSHLISITSGTPSKVEPFFDQTLRPGESFQFRFTQVGAFNYFCRFAPDEMVGVVNVVP